MSLSDTMVLTLLPSHVERYIEQRAAHRDAVLQRMEAQARRENFPIVGPQVGQLLVLLARAATLAGEPAVAAEAMARVAAGPWDADYVAGLCAVGGCPHR